MSKQSRRLPGWFKACLVVLVGLIILKAMQLQVFIEVSHAGAPFVIGVTELETYLLAVGLLLVYILLNWGWEKVFPPRDMDG